VRVLWSVSAVREIQRAHDYIAEFYPEAALRVAETPRDAGYSLQHFPLRGRRVPGTDLRELVTSFSYLIRYLVAGDVVEIVSIRHTSRRPTVP
jgi:plasmid stabilization system protein ParE